MSKLKATPGPWAINWATVNGKRTGFHITAAPHGSTKPIAGSYSHLSNPPHPDLESNAHLAVSAHDLYEALVNTLSLVRMHTGPDDSIAQTAISQAETALSRARGEKQD